MVQFSIKTLLIAVAIVAAFLAGWQWGRVEDAYSALQHARDRAEWAAEKRRFEEEMGDVGASNLFLVPQFPAISR